MTPIKTELLSSSELHNLHVHGEAAIINSIFIGSVASEGFMLDMGTHSSRLVPSIQLLQISAWLKIGRSEPNFEGHCEGGMRD